MLQGQPTDDDKVHKLLEAGNFSKLYAHAMLEATPASAERREITRGSWVKYGQIEGHYEPDYAVGADGEAEDQTPIDDETAMRLVKSLRGHGTTWCTAGTRTAAAQLSMGDFYVYYSEDEEGKDTIPRAAIRMEYGRVAEVRGIEAKQNLEGAMMDIVYDKLCELPGGESYYKKVEDMRRLTEIDNRVQNGGELTAQDLVFLRFSGGIEGFGYEEGDDPRVDDLLEGRDEDDDIEIVLNDSDIDATVFASKLIKSEGIDLVADNLDKFIAAGADIDPTALVAKLIKLRYFHMVIDDLDKLLAAGADPTALATQLIDSERAQFVAENLDKFLTAGADIDPTALATQLIDSDDAQFVAGNLDKFLTAGADIDLTALATQLIEQGYSDKSYAVARHLDKFIAAGADIDPTALATQLVDSGHGDYVVNYLDKFIAAGADIDPTALATRLINPMHVRFVARNLDKFVAAGADQTEIERLIADARRK